ncbi:MAG: phosphate acyltransferase PlsX [Phycisphaeraceae bacterium]|nr:phosphate acyltransferase PlsX [Phycisphaeraceae bacterium]
MRIAIDVMGGDNAPDAILDGSIDALAQLSPDDRLVLIGDEAVIRDVMHERGVSNDPRIEVEATTQVIAMDDPPVTAIRNKPDSSIVRMAQLGGSRRQAGNRHCDIIISAGNTGACVAAAQMCMRRLPGVHRPGIAVVMPSFHGPIVLCDVGANPEPKPPHLHQYAIMGSVYARRVVGIENPRVALLSIGSEEAKGNHLVKETAPLLKHDESVNYVGYAEGRDLFDGKADVCICEGFTGNVVLKLAEGLASGLFRTIAKEILDTDPDLASRFEPVVKSIYAKHDYHEYGGAPLLGANGVCIICHGSSIARTISSAVRNAMRYTRLNVNAEIVEALSGMTPVEEGAA